MSVRINFHFVCDYFRDDDVRIPVEWTFPFLPRVGESVGGWVWIQQGEWKQEEIESRLTREGQKRWEEYREGGGRFEDWLYEVATECGKICSIGYVKLHDSPSGEIRVNMWLNGDGEPL